MRTGLEINEVKRLTGREKALLRKRYALHRKYSEALALYAETELTLREIAEKCNMSPGGLGSYLRRHWRELVLQRHRIPVKDEDPAAIRIVSAGRQHPVAHAKYKDAVEACDTMEHIGLNISQVARKFGVDGTALANFMRIHYADILVRREEARRKLGLSDNIHHGVRKVCAEQYREAVELYRSTEMTLPEIAEICHVSGSGLSQHLRFYHKDVIEQKRRMRKQAAIKQSKKRGGLLGNGRKYEPACRTEQKYAEALALYRNTDLTMKDIVRKTRVPAEGFRFYLHKWHKTLVWEHLGITGHPSGQTDLRKAGRRMKTVAAKYAEAIKSLKENPRPSARVAAEFGFHPEVFRSYLHKHEPELAGQIGMTHNREGKLVSVRGEKKYSEAVRLYETTAESLKAISRRLGLTYNSVGGYIRRNRPDVIRRHRELLAARNNDR